MPPLRARLGVIVAALLSAQVPAPAGLQERPLLVVSSSPAGEVGQISDATEIRIVFSEPMVALGTPSTGAPPWLSIEPAFAANYFWSGTRTLIVTADPSRPLPYATRYTVRIDGAARSTSGRQLASPHTFTFTTPTVRLLSAEWYRKTGRADSPAVIALRFNQPVRQDDVLAHTRVRYAAHPWTAPSIDAAAREILESRGFRRPRPVFREGRGDGARRRIDRAGGGSSRARVGRETLSACADAGGDRDNDATGAGGLAGGDARRHVAERRWPGNARPNRRPQ